MNKKIAKPEQENFGNDCESPKEKIQQLRPVMSITS